MLKTQPVVFRAAPEYDADKSPVSSRVGLRVFLLAALACVAVFEPSWVTAYGPFVATFIYLTGRPEKLRIDLPNVAALVLAVWALASTAWSLSPDLSWRVGLNYLSMAIVFIAARDAIRTVAQMRVVVIGYIIGCFVLAGRVIMQAWQGTALVDDRLNLEGLNINYAGYAFALGFAMIVLLAVTKPLTLRRSLGLLTTAAALVIGTYLADTRGAFVGLALMVVWLLLCKIFKKPPFKILVLFVLTAAWAIATGAFDGASLALESLLGRPTGDWSGRLIIWPMAREDWANDFWIGTGASNFMHQNLLGIGAHNLVLELGTGLGVVGVALYGVLLWSALGTRTVDAGSKLRPILVGSFLAVSVFSYLTGHWELAPAAWIGLAVFSRIGELCRADPADSFRGSAN